MIVRCLRRLSFWTAISQQPSHKKIFWIDPPTFSLLGGALDHLANPESYSSAFPIKFRDFRPSVYLRNTQECFATREYPGPRLAGEKPAQMYCATQKKELLKMTFSHMDGRKYDPIMLILTPANGRDYQSDVSKNQLVWSRFHIRCFRWYCPYDDIQTHGGYTWVG